MNCFHLVTNALQSAVFMETVHHLAQFTFFSELYLWKQSSTPLYSRSSVRCIYGNRPPYRSIHVLRWGAFMETAHHPAQFTFFSELYLWKQCTIPLKWRSSVNGIYEKSLPPRSIHVVQWNVSVYGNSAPYHSIYVFQWTVLWKQSTTLFNLHFSMLAPLHFLSIVFTKRSPPRSIHITFAIGFQKIISSSNLSVRMKNWSHPRTLACLIGDRRHRASLPIFQGRLLLDLLNAEPSPER